MQLYGSAVRGLQEYLQGCGIERAQDVSAAHLQEYRLCLHERQLKPATVAVYLRGIRLLFRHLENRREILLNPADSLPPVRHIRRLLPVPAESDMRKLLARPDTSTPLGVRDRTLLETAYGTAARLHPVQIQALLGHASLRHLSQYLGVTVCDIRRMHERSRPGS